MLGRRRRRILFPRALFCFISPLDPKSSERKRNSFSRFCEEKNYHPSVQEIVRHHSLWRQLILNKITRVIPSLDFMLHLSSLIPRKKSRDDKPPLRQRQVTNSVSLPDKLSWGMIPCSQQREQLMDYWRRGTHILSESSPLLRSSDQRFREGFSWDPDSGHESWITNVIVLSSSSRVEVHFSSQDTIWKMMTEVTLEWNFSCLNYFNSIHSCLSDNQKEMKEGERESPGEQR